MQFSVEHIGLAARDPIALKDWYVRVLSARIVFQTDQTPPAFFLELPGHLYLEIYKSHLASPETSLNTLAGWRHLALRIDSIEAARQTLIDRGIAFDEPVKPAGGCGQVLFFKDGEGNLLHLVERHANSPIR